MGSKELEAILQTVGPLLEARGEDRVRLAMKQAADISTDATDWCATLLPHIKLISTSASSSSSSTSPTASSYNPWCTFAFTVLPHHCNRLGNLHGGCTATLFDWCTSVSLALVSAPGFWTFLGVTRTLNVTYLRPAPAGTEVEIRCEVVQAGKRLATLRGVITRKDNGAVVAVCEHGKVNIDPPASSKM